MRIPFGLLAATAAPPPSISAVTPTHGPESTATTITIDGTDFVNGCTVTLNGFSCTSVTFVSSIQVTCDTPSNMFAGGPYDVTLTNPDTQSDTYPNAYTFDAPSFDPLSVGTPLVWYDLAHQTNGAGIITALPDQSGNGNDATVPGGDEPGFTASNAAFNNLPTMDIPSGDTKHVNTPDLGLTTGAVTFAIVFSAAGNYILSASNAKAEVYLPGGDVTGTNDDGTTNLTGAAMPAVAVVVYIANGASSKLYVNAKTPATGDAGAQDLTGQTIRLGHYGGGLSNAFGWAQDGSTAHFVAYDGALSQGDVEYLLDGFGALAGVTIGA